jgi:hypothetical protein
MLMFRFIDAQTFNKMSNDYAYGQREREGGGGEWLRESADVLLVIKFISTRASSAKPSWTRALECIKSFRKPDFAMLQSFLFKNFFLEGWNP